MDFIKIFTNDDSDCNYVSLQELKDVITEDNINEIDADKMTPFAYLCYYSDKNKFDMSILQYCISIGGDLNKICKMKLTPFQWLCYRMDGNLFDIEMLKYCIANGGDVNYRNNFGNTIFHTIFYFTREKTLDYPKYAISINIDTKNRNNEGETIYHIMFSKYVDMDLLRFCIEELKIDLNNTTSKYADTMFYSICNTIKAHMGTKMDVNDALEIVKYCVQYGANINAKNYIQYSPFKLLCHGSINMELFKYCVSVGGDIQDVFTALCNKDPNDINSVTKMTYDMFKYCVSVGLNINDNPGINMFCGDSILDNILYLKNKKIFKYIRKHNLLKQETIQKFIQNENMSLHQYCKYFIHKVICH